MASSSKFYHSFTVVSRAKEASTVLALQSTKQVCHIQLGSVGLKGLVLCLCSVAQWHLWHVKANDMSDLHWYLTVKAEQPFVSRNVQWSTADPMLNYCITQIHSIFRLLFPSRQNSLCPQIFAWTLTSSPNTTLPSVLHCRRCCSRATLALQGKLSSPSVQPMRFITFPATCGLHCTT